MTVHYNAAIWIDHREARVFHFSPTDETLVLHPDNPTRPSQGKFYRERARIDESRLSSRGRRISVGRWLGSDYRAGKCKDRVG
jgi:hypothetical protein